MRNIKFINLLFFMTVLAIASCKLDPVIYPTNTGINIKYQVILSQNCNCKITYADSLNYEVTETVLDSKWKKSFKVLNKDYFKTAYLTITSLNPAVEPSGTASIFVNGVLKGSAAFTATPSSSGPVVSIPVKN